MLYNTFNKYQVLYNCNTIKCYPNASFHSEGVIPVIRNSRCSAFRFGIASWINAPSIQRCNCPERIGNSMLCITPDNMDRLVTRTKFSATCSIPSIILYSFQEKCPTSDGFNLINCPNREAASTDIRHKHKQPDS